MHSAALALAHINSEILSTPTKPASRGLNAVEADSFAKSLLKDSDDYSRSAVISFADALHAMARGFYSWSIVKLYYSSFYSCRSCLALDGWGCYYVKEKPFRIRAAIGESAVKWERNSHKAIFQLYAERYPSDALVQQRVDLYDPLQWLRRLRESINYNDSRFCEPETHISLAMLQISSPGRLMDQYIRDVSHTYTFLKDHAAMALPAQCLVRMHRANKAKSRCPIEQSLATHLGKRLALPNCKCSSFRDIIDDLLAE